MDAMKRSIFIIYCQFGNENSGSYPKMNITIKIKILPFHSIS